MNSKYVFLICFAMCSLTGCAITSTPYPDTWPQVESNKSSTPNSCPSIAGLYHDMAISVISGKRSVSFSGRDSDKSYLTYNLFSNARHASRYQGYISEDTQQLNGYPVEINQSSTDELELIVWGNFEGNRFVRHKEVLSMKAGDFSCGPHGLQLRSRSEILILVVANSVSSVARTLNRASDESLVMRVDQTQVGQFFYFPVGTNSDYWIRWEPLKKNPAKFAD